MGELWTRKLKEEDAPLHSSGPQVMFQPWWARYLQFFVCSAMDEWTIAPTPTWRPGRGPMSVRSNHSSPNLLSTSIRCLPTLFRGVRRSPRNKTSGLCCSTKPTSSHIEQLDPLNPTLRNPTVKGLSHRSDRLAGGMVHGSPATKLPYRKACPEIVTRLTVAQAQDLHGRQQARASLLSLLQLQVGMQSCQPELDSKWDWGWPK